MPNPEATVGMVPFQSCAAPQSPRDSGIRTSPFVPIEDGHPPSQIIR